MTIFEAFLLPGRSRRSSLLAAALVAWGSAFAPLHARAADNEPKQAEQTEQTATREEKSAQKAAAIDPADKAPNDLESCRRDAEGMKGPERSRFMTSCLKARK